ncbi:MAG: hypothetical protein RBT34_08470 [Anaerolineaceae bacterium]|jgi:DNA-directed RNA polymerase subunit E'/Rpb7|nr:hypothetical protein [Anaerolineaceae bacterium]
MSAPSSRSSVALGNKIQSAIAKAVQDHNQGMGQSQITSALVVMVDEQNEVKEMSVVTNDELTTFALMYEDKIK